MQYSGPALIATAFALLAEGLTSENKHLVDHIAALERSLSRAKLECNLLARQYQRVFHSAVRLDAQQICGGISRDAPDSFSFYDDVHAPSEEEPVVGSLMIPQDSTIQGVNELNGASFDCGSQLYQDISLVPCETFPAARDAHTKAFDTLGMNSEQTHIDWGTDTLPRHKDYKLVGLLLRFGKSVFRLIHDTFGAAVRDVVPSDEKEVRKLTNAYPVFIGVPCVSSSAATDANQLLDEPAATGALHGCPMPQRLL